MSCTFKPNLSILAPFPPPPPFPPPSPPLLSHNLIISLKIPQRNNCINLFCKCSYPSLLPQHLSLLLLLLPLSLSSPPPLLPLLSSFSPLFPAQTFFKWDLKIHCSFIFFYCLGFCYIANHSLDTIATASSSSSSPSLSSSILKHIIPLSVTYSH